MIILQNSDLRTLLNQRRVYFFAVIAVTIILLLPTPKPVEIAGQTISISFQGQAAIALLVGLIIIFVTEALALGATVGIVYAWIIFLASSQKKMQLEFLAAMLSGF